MSLRLSKKLSLYICELAFNGYINFLSNSSTLSNTVPSSLTLAKGSLKIPSFSLFSLK